MTTQQTDIEKTLKRILARGLTEWPSGTEDIAQGTSGKLYDQSGDVVGFISEIAADRNFSLVTRAEWEAERALLALDQAQPLGDSEEFDQALWDKVAISFIGGSAADQRATWTEKGTKEIVEQASSVADAFMAERAKRIAERKASHD